VSRERGFALIAALWLLVAIGTIGLGIELRARARHLAAANAVDETRARAAAEAGLAEMQDRLVGLLGAGPSVGAPDPRRGLDPWGALYARATDTVALGTARAVVRLTDLGTRINLDRATEDELRRLFVALRIDAGEADRLAQRIMDWRDPDDLRRARGAEHDDYVRSGVAVLPENAPFTRLGELQDVLGMTPRVFEAIRPYLTLRGTGRVNLAAAERPVLLTLPGFGEQAVALVLRRRSAGRPIANLAELVSELPSGPRERLVVNLPALESRVTYDTRELDAASEGELDGSPVRVWARGLFVRAGSSVFLVGRESE
jgi:general secretion pathway protein K